MIERNAKIKNAPEKWQEHPNAHIYDIIICFEERVYEAVIEGFFEIVYAILNVNCKFSF